jgi:hypothetical protein
VGATQAPGQIGQGLAFDGVDNRITINIPYTFQDFSFSFFANPLVPIHGFPRLLNTSSHAMDHEWVNTSKSYRFRWPTSSGIGEVDSDTGYFNVDEPHHYAVTYDFTTVTFYRDGVQFGSTKTLVGSEVQVTFDLLFNNSVLGTGIKGVWDDVRIYNRVLSPGEVQRLYQLGN